MNEKHFKCKHSQFGWEQYDRFADFFWRLPSALGAPESTLLRDLLSAGGAGAIRLLPLLGCVAGLDLRGGWRLSLEEGARLAGVDSKSCRRGRDALQDAGLATTRKTLHFGKPVTLWSVAPQLAATTSGNEWFRFSMRVVYGGHWAKMTHVQCAVYLAVATKAIKLDAAVSNNWIIQETLPYEADLFDLEACHRACGNLRVASVSKAEIQRVTGYSAAAVDEAVRGFRHANDWPGGSKCSQCPELLPIRVYPTEGGNLLYHFRDHVSAEATLGVRRPIAPVTVATVASRPARPSVGKAISPVERRANDSSQASPASDLTKPNWDERAARATRFSGREE